MEGSFGLTPKTLLDLFVQSHCNHCKATIPEHVHRATNLTSSWHYNRLALQALSLSAFTNYADCLRSCGLATVSQKAAARDRFELRHTLTCARQEAHSPCLNYSCSASLHDPISSRSTGPKNTVSQCVCCISSSCPSQSQSSRRASYRASKSAP